MRSFRRFLLTDPSGGKNSFPVRLCIFVLVSFLMMQLLENRLRWITLHSRGRPLRLGLNS
jgi:hypothetical protein